MKELVGFEWSVVCFGLVIDRSSFRRMEISISKENATNGELALAAFFWSGFGKFDDLQIRVRLLIFWMIYFRQSQVDTWEFEVFALNGCNIPERSEIAHTSDLRLCRSLLCPKPLANSGQFEHVLRAVEFPPPFSYGFYFRIGTLLQ